VIHLDRNTARGHSTPRILKFEHDRSFRMAPGTHHYLRDGVVLSPKNAKVLPERRDPKPKSLELDQPWPPALNRLEASSLQNERKMVDRFVERYREQMPGMVREYPLDKGRLRIDLWVPERNTIVEAKWPLKSGDLPLTRASVRMAIGQLLDYRTTAHEESLGAQSLAVMLPDEPEESIRDLLTALRIGLIWETPSGSFTDSLEGRWLKSARAPRWPGPTRL
jgi:hypothetical protein